MNSHQVGNKCDLSTKRVVSTEEAQELADSLGISFMETSARNSHNVEKFFEKISEEIKGSVKPR